jgi:hypothetical protein
VPAKFRNADLRGEKNLGARFTLGANAAKTREFVANSRRDTRAIMTCFLLSRVAGGCEVLGYSLRNRPKFLHITPGPKPISVGIAGTRGRLSPAAEKFWQCAKEAAAPSVK